MIFWDIEKWVPIYKSCNVRTEKVCNIEPDFLIVKEENEEIREITGTS